MLILRDCTWLHAPPFRSRPPSRVRCSKVPMATSIRIAIVGDVHNDWNLEEDTKALQLLKPDLVLFTGRCTGDFGNENVDIVRSISNLDFATAVILGNHDAWKTRKFAPKYHLMTFLSHTFLSILVFPMNEESFHLPVLEQFPVGTILLRKEKDSIFALPLSVEKDAVQLQLEYLGEAHVGYRRLDFPNFKLSIVGGRPFSCGGDYMFRNKLLAARYSVHKMDESAKRIYQAALTTPTDHSVIFLAHNGPTGLGSNVDDICGRDWVPEGGDHGDPDLAVAISQLKATTKQSIKLVVFGHMHKELAYGKGVRKMIVVGDDSTVYLNGAIVPRVKTISNEQVSHISSSNTEMTSAIASDFKGTLRAFTIADIVDGNLEKVTETWVLVIKDIVKIENKVVLFNKAAKM
ncbi:calcineurin-like metallo-phosphoesterase super family protein [Striga asiatica]|uniref:Calcineurin-like metallo-phosphoesterase super family protein n=1 Tax=Striga asiatica TaxID=4170 RepID=A0A5A7QL32_STRAF|nr:calcineurin-like metallo-phosphoesterase super family protein [Striga asiatica]